jgi:hypothetical protein
MKPHTVNSWHNIVSLSNIKKKNFEWFLDLDVNLFLYNIRPLETKNVSSRSDVMATDNVLMYGAIVFRRIEEFPFES